MKKLFLAGIGCAVPGTHVWGCGALAELSQQRLGYNELLLQRGHMALRVARGLFRVWLVLSVLWIGGVGYVTWKDISGWVSYPSGEPVPWWADLSIHDPSIHSGIVLAVVPPALVLAFGSALVWAFRGFR